MAREKILVTGGAGFIGAHTLVELHKAGFTPIVVDNFSRSDYSLLEGVEALTGSPVLLYKGDCVDRKFLSGVFAEHNVSGVIHFAAYKSVEESVTYPLIYYRNNLDSLLSLLEVMSEYKVGNFIFSSSCTVYGEPDSCPVDELAPLKVAESPYGTTKQIAEQVLRDAAKADLNLSVIALRYFNPIGAHPSALIGELPLGKPTNLVPYITQTAAGVREKLTIFGSYYDTPDGTCIRDFIHVVDLAKAHVSATVKLFDRTRSPGFECYNLGTGIGVSVLQLVKEFIEVSGINLNYEIGQRRPGDLEVTYANPTKAKKELRWTTQYSTKDALLHAWEWEKRIRDLR